MVVPVQATIKKPELISCSEIGFAHQDHVEIVPVGDFLPRKRFAFQKTVLSQSIARSPLSITGYCKKQICDEGNAPLQEHHITWGIAATGFELAASLPSEAPARLLELRSDRIGCTISDIPVALDLIQLHFQLLIMQGNSYYILLNNELQILNILYKFSNFKKNTDA